MEWLLQCVVSALFGMVLLAAVQKLNKTRSNTARRLSSKYPGRITKQGFDHVLLEYEPVTPEDTIEKSENFYTIMNKRRSVRFFSNKPVPFQVIQNVIKTAGTSPSGAHQQPWTFVVVHDKNIKHAIREAAEKEEQVNYSGRMNEQWQSALSPLATDANKEFLDIAPYLIVAFKQTHSYTPG